MARLLQQQLFACSRTGVPAGACMHERLHAWMRACVQACFHKFGAEIAQHPFRHCKSVFHHLRILYFGYKQSGAYKQVSWQQHLATCMYARMHASMQ
eukprot:366465-Chlamydomonas_euryale.AAC.4